MNSTKTHSGCERPNAVSNLSTECGYWFMARQPWMFSCKSAVTNAISLVSLQLQLFGIKCITCDSQRTKDLENFAKDLHKKKKGLCFCSTTCNCRVLCSTLTHSFSHLVQHPKLLKIKIHSSDIAARTDAFVYLNSFTITSLLPL